MSLIVRWVVIWVVLAAPMSRALAQSPEDFFRRLFEPDQRVAVETEWRGVASEEAACLDQALRQRGSSLRAIVRRGVGPSDGRLAELRAACPNGGAEAADVAGPSFACRRASRPDEVAICRDRDLSQLDRTISAGFAALQEKLGERRARQMDNQWLRERRACFDDAACIKRVQLATIADFARQGVPIEPPDQTAAESVAPSATPNPADNQPPAASTQIAPPATSPTQDRAIAVAPPLQPSSPSVDTPAASPPAPSPAQAVPSKDVRVILPGPVAAEPRGALVAPSPSPAKVEALKPETSNAEPPKAETRAIAAGTGSASSINLWLVGLIVVLLAIIAALIVVIRGRGPLRVAPAHTPPMPPSSEPAVAPSAPAVSEAALNHSVTPINLDGLAPTERPVDDVKTPGAPLATTTTSIAMLDQTKPSVAARTGDPTPA